MCRVFAYSSRGSTGDLVFNGLNALRSAAEADPMGPSGTINHSDGWGFAIVNHNDDVLFKWHYRSLIPIYRDTNYQPLAVMLSNLAKLGETYGIFHVLNAADKRLTRVEMVHPSMAYVRDGELYIVHNGVVDKHKVFSELRRRYNATLDVENSSDTFVLTHLVALMYNELGGLEPVIRELAGMLRETNSLESALNTGILLVKQCCVELFLTTMYSDEVLSNEKRRKYYNLFIGRLSNGVFAASSTLVRVYGLSKMGDVTELEPSKDELIYCKMQPSGINCGSA